MLLLSHLCLGILDRPTQWTGLAVCSPKVETHQNYSIKVQLTHLTLAIPSHSVWAIGLGIPITQKVHADHVESACKLYEWYMLGDLPFWGWPFLSS